MPQINAPEISKSVSVGLVLRFDPGSDHAENVSKTEEFQDLARALDYTISFVVSQERFPDRRYNIGHGKAEELAFLAMKNKVRELIFYDPLSTSQVYNLSKICHKVGASCRVIDRFHLIIDIFDKRATTHRSKLQVELARLTYELPNAKMLVSLSKKEEKAGFGGLGDYEDSYEYDLKRRISRIRNELKKADTEEESRRLYRHKMGFLLLSLAGYTNAGKSTLFNLLAHEKNKVADMLFTTLVPKTRLLQIGRQKLLITDTVGFIEDLPHFLVDAFKSTLDGIFYSDLILLVVDFSEPVEKIAQKLKVCHTTLWDRSSSEIITVLNKSDMVPRSNRAQKLKQLSHLISNPVFISAKNGHGIENLENVILSCLPEQKTAVIMLPNTQQGASALSWFYDRGIVDEIIYGNFITFDFTASDEILDKAEFIILEAYNASGTKLSPEFCRTVFYFPSYAQSDQDFEDQNDEYLSPFDYDSVG